ncbi:polymorphic toxin-type HINT domain-containing protein [Nocardiopsis sp. CNT312]|uniref:polymorphic toxin-type HINT domain-containing protein n=1 Tax=Nocardiopsis sp. CNT312 TaxID=1137268 RepID=UPI00048D6C98|nr:polymorphic toxin-type HINT domain-containing protein [Nocardiopsis sp. CNT312]
MLLRRYDTTASFVEYAAVVALASIIATALFASGIPLRIGDGIADAVDDGLSADGSVSEGGEGEPGSGGSAGSTDVEPAPHNPEEDGGGVTPAVWTGGDDFVVQQTWSFDESWEWGTGGQPAFEFEDHGDYNWDCGWVFHYLCRAGGGLAQGADGAIEDGKTALCHVHLCSNDSFEDAWSNTWDGVTSLWDDPLGSLEGMWDGFWETPQRNDENLSGGDAFAKNFGYWVTQIPGTVLKPFKFLGDGGRSPDRDGDQSQDQDGIDCSNSFVPGTPVLLADGTAKPIELIAVGDRVLASDPETGEQGPREVTHLITGGGAKTLVDVVVDDGSGGTASVTATDNHLFWEPEQGWTDAIDLEPGSWLRTSAGVWVRVEAVDVYTVAEQDVHNLTVEDLRTYHVVAGRSPLLVHNSGPCREVGPYESTGSGQDLKRTAQVGDDQWHFNTGHGYDRPHTGPGGVQTDLRTTDLTPDQIEHRIVNDVYDHIDNGGAIPQPGTQSFRPRQGTVQIDGHSIGYRVILRPDGAYQLSTYWLNP